MSDAKLYTMAELLEDEANGCMCADPATHARLAAPDAPDLRYCSRGGIEHGRLRATVEALERAKASVAAHEAMLREIADSADTNLREAETECARLNVLLERATCPPDAPCQLEQPCLTHRAKAAEDALESSVAEVKRSWLALEKAEAAAADVGRGWASPKQVREIALGTLRETTRQYAQMWQRLAIGAPLTAANIVVVDTEAIIARVLGGKGFV